MDELVNLVAKKAGISKQQAQKAVETVKDYLDDGLPEPFAKQVDSVLKGENISDSLSDLAGGLFGKK